MKNVWILDDDYNDGIKVFSNPQKLFNYLISEKLITIKYPTFLNKLKDGAWISSPNVLRRISAYKKSVI